MTRPLVFAANWKMHLGPAATREYLRVFLEGWRPLAHRAVVFFPPALSVTAAAALVRDCEGIAVGVQNLHWESAGAFTGESSAPMARDAGARFALVGHSERRWLFGETDAMTARKCEAAVSAGLTPVLCVGEQLGERERGETAEVVLRQLRIGLGRLAVSDVARTMIAYEPVWAIGSGHHAQPEDAAAVHALLREELGRIAPAAAAVVPVLYGGSVSARNAHALLAAPGVDGLLVGGASLDPLTWLEIVAS